MDPRNTAKYGEISPVPGCRGGEFWVGEGGQHSGHLQPPVPAYQDRIPGFASLGNTDPEMEFLYINLTKDLSLLLHAIHRRKPYVLFSGFKNPYKK
jgi:hypothetical protein